LASTKPPLGRDDAGALEVAEDLLEKSQRDALTLGDVARQRGRGRVEGHVEDRAHRVATLARELEHRP
jgi:hypothetical protein